MQLGMAVNQSVFVASDWLAYALDREVSASRANSCTFPLQTESVQLHPLLLLLLPPSLHVFITHSPPPPPPVTHTQLWGFRPGFLVVYRTALRLVKSSGRKTPTSMIHFKLDSLQMSWHVMITLSFACTICIITRKLFMYLISWCFPWTARTEKEKDETRTSPDVTSELLLNQIL